MGAPNRSGEVAAWVNSHRSLFVTRPGVDVDDQVRELLTPLARHLNTLEGRDAWGVLVKSERTPPFIPHDILCWKDTREHIDVFTGNDRIEDVQPMWGYNPPPDDARWIWQSVGADAPVSSTDRAFVEQQLTALYARYGYRPTGPRSGPTDLAYYAEKVIETGGWTSDTPRHEDNIGYWTGRVRSDLLAANMPIPGPFADGGGEAHPPANDDDGRIAALEQQLAALTAQLAGAVATVGSQGRDIEELKERLHVLEDKPAPTFELPALRVRGNTGRIFGHGHPIDLLVERV